MADFDAGSMRRAVLGLPAQLEAAWRALAPGPARGPRPEAVVAVGMGGSGVAADVAASLWEPDLTVPVHVVRGPELPGWVGPRHLVLFSSYSGQTDETLTAWDAAAETGATRLAITTGGALAARAVAQGAAMLELPVGMAPRAALGWSLAAVLAALTRAGALAADPGTQLDDAVQAMAEAAADSRAADEVAAKLAGRVAWIIAPRPLAAVARRWRTQLNENAKVAAYWDETPEINHNAVEGLTAPVAVAGLQLAVFLSAAAAGPEHERYLAAARAVIGEAGIPGMAVHAEDEGLAAAGLRLIQIGDMVSVELSRLGGVDPTPVDTILRVKSLIARGN